MDAHTGRMETRQPHIELGGPMSLADYARAHHPRAAAWADEFVLSRERVGAAERGRLYRLIRSGELVVVRPGVCLPTRTWSTFTADDRYPARVRSAALAFRAPLVFVGESAAALWRLPKVGAWSAVPVVAGARASGGRSTRTLHRRCEGVPSEVWAVEGLATSGLAGTVLDVSRHASFGVAVAMADRALAFKRGSGGGVLAESVDKTQLWHALGILGTTHRAGKAKEVIEFADGDSGSAGESISRVVIYRLGFPAPILQFEFRDAHGRMIVDFWWPEFALIGEFDGRGKYLREEFTRGRSTAETVLDEKSRENRLRALGPTVARWGWDDAMAPPRLRRTLVAAGLPFRN
jgi:hypothetical protein